MDTKISTRGHQKAYSFFLYGKEVNSFQFFEMQKAVENYSFFLAMLVLGPIPGIPLEQIHFG